MHPCDLQLLYYAADDKGNPQTHQRTLLHCDIQPLGPLDDPSSQAGAPLARGPFVFIKWT